MRQVSRQRPTLSGFLLSPLFYFTSCGLSFQSYIKLDKEGYSQMKNIRLAKKTNTGDDFQKNVSSPVFLAKIETIPIEDIRK